MPRTCTVCTHTERDAIDAALIAGTSAPKIAAIHRVSDDAVTRHRAHLAIPLAKARQVQAVRVAEEARDVAHALDVVRQLRDINAAALDVLRGARASGEGELVLKAVDRVQRQIELQAKLLGDLDERPVVNLWLSPEWQAVRAALLTALGPYPEVRTAVAAKLIELEGA